MSIYPALRSIVGRRLGLSKYGNLIASPNATEIDLTPKCVDCSITVGDQTTHTRAITIQLKDANGADIDYVEEVEIALFTTADRTAYAATGGSTGIAIGTDGALQTILAKKRFLATSEADGDIDLTWVDDADEAAFIGVKLPTGRYVMANITNA